MFAATASGSVGENTTIWSSSWLSNGGIAVGCIDGSTKILSPSLETKFDIKSQHMGIVSVTYNSEIGLIATNTVDGHICIRNSETGALIKSMSVGPMEAWQIAFSPAGGILFTGNGLGTVKAWAFEKEISTVRHLISSLNPLLVLCKYTIDTKAGFIMSVAVSSDGLYLATGHKDGSVCVINLNTKKLIRSFHNHSLTVRCLCFSSTGLLYSGSDDKIIVCYDIRTQDSAVVRTFSGHSGWVTGLTISKDDTYLLSCSTDKRVIVYSLKDEEGNQSMNCHNCMVWGVQFNEDGSKVLSIADDGSMQIYQRQEKL